MLGPNSKVKWIALNIHLYHILGVTAYIEARILQVSCFCCIRPPARLAKQTAKGDKKMATGGIAHAMELLGNKC